ncbi:MAG: hypothetical protein K1Y36_08290 [Blastocatellia bacterium]|nr:hypothetical protein [Blastocatellia bacterium]
MLKFYSKAWLDEIAKRLEADARFAQEGKKLNGTFVFRVYDGPDGKDRRTSWTFKNGKALDWKYLALPAPADDIRKEPYSGNWIMRATSTFDLMSKVNRGEISPTRAMSMPQYQIEGNKSLIMTMMKPITVWNEITAGIEVAYDFTEDD